MFVAIQRNGSGFHTGGALGRSCDHWPDCGTRYITGARYLGTARVDTTKAPINNFESALELYYIDTGRYPTTDEGLGVLQSKPAAESRWNGPYIKKSGAFVDAWGTPCLYKSPAENTPFSIISSDAIMRWEAKVKSAYASTKACCLVNGNIQQSSDFGTMCLGMGRSPIDSCRYHGQFFRTGHA